MPSLGSVPVYRTTQVTPARASLLEYAAQHQLPIGLLDVDARTGIIVYNLEDAGELHPHFPFLLTGLRGGNVRSKRMYRTIEEAQKVAASMIQRKDMNVEELFVCEVVSRVGVVEAPIEARPWGNRNVTPAPEPVEEK